MKPFGEERFQRDHDASCQVDRLPLMQGVGSFFGLTLNVAISHFRRIMSDKVFEKQEISFQTPNPIELKQAAKDNSSQEEYLGSNEATVANIPPQDQNVDQPNPPRSDLDSEVLHESQTIRVNLSGH